MWNTLCSGLGPVWWLTLQWCRRWLLCIPRPPSLEDCMVSLDTKSCFPAGWPWRGTSLMSRPSGRILPYSAFPPHLGVLPSRPTSSYRVHFPGPPRKYWAWLSMASSITSHEMSVHLSWIELTGVETTSCLSPWCFSFFFFFFLGMATLVTIGLEKKSRLHWDCGLSCVHFFPILHVPHYSLSVSPSTSWLRSWLQIPILHRKNCSPRCQMKWVSPQEKASNSQSMATSSISIYSYG